MSLRPSSRSLSRTAVAGAVTTLTLMTFAGGAMAQSATNGATLYGTNCAGCHGTPNTTLNGGTGFYKITRGWDATVIKGTTQSTNALYVPMMASFAGYSDAQFNDLAAYIAPLQNKTPSYIVVAAPVASLSANAQTFGNVTVGATSAAQTINITNTGTAALTVSSVTSNNTAFAVTHTCTTVAVNGSCTVTTTFTPGSAAAATGTLSIVTNAGTQTVALSGTGTAAPAPVVGLSSSAAQAFGNVNVGATGTAKTITLSNTGNADLTGINITAPAGFTVAGTCGATLAAPVAPATSTSCDIITNFAPTAAGAASGNLSIATTNGGTPTVALSGTGTQPAISFNATSLTFSALPNGTSAAQHVTLTNTGSGPLTISGITLPAGFSATANSCVTNPTTAIAAAATCGFDVTFTGAATQATGTLSPVTISTADTLGTSQTLNLTGNTLAATAPTLVWADATGTALASASLTVGTAAVTVGGTATATITLKNTNTTASSAINAATAITVTGAAASEFAVSAPTCVAATNLCTYTVTFTPASAGAKTATLHVTEAGSVIPLDFSVTATGAAAPVPASSSSSGGCSIGGAGDATDPLWLVILAGAGLALRRRNKRA